LSLLCTTLTHLLLLLLLLLLRHMCRCYTTFTAGQIARIQSSWATFRANR
jgi:hypothetical protein